MKIDGTIIITDPYYFAEKKKKKEFDCNTMSIDPSLGFTDYIWNNTGVGDGRWKVSEMNDGIFSGMELENFIEHIEDAYYNFFKKSSIENQIKLEELINKRTTIGRYCVDSGTFGVFKLNEVLGYCPDFLVTHGYHCYTIIKDFIGDVDTYTDSRNQKHIIGVGNKSFYSNTVSWL